MGSSFSLTLPPFSTLDGITFNWSTEVCCKLADVCQSVRVCWCCSGWMPFPLENEIFNEIYLFVVALNHLRWVSVYCVYFGCLFVCCISVFLDSVLLFYTFILSFYVSIILCLMPFAGVCVCFFGFKRIFHCRTQFILCSEFQVTLRPICACVVSVQMLNFFCSPS